MTGIEFPGTSPEDLVDMFNEFGGVLRDELDSAAEDISLRVMRSAQREVNVDTGRLRASIQQETERVAEHTVRALVGSNVEYAPFHEMDYPYLRPAFEANREYIVDRIKEAVDTAWDEVI